MRNTLLTILATGLVMLSATAASAGTMTLGSRAQAGPVQVSFDEDPTIAYGTAFGTIGDVSFTGLFADREFTAPSGGPYNGFANFFGGGVVASNFIIPYVEETNLQTMHIQSSAFSLTFANDITAFGFDFVTQPALAFQVSLYKDGSLITDSPTSFQMLVDGDGYPIVGFAGLQNLGGFDEARITLASDEQFFSMNDVRFGGGGITAVPLPPAAFLGLGMLVGIGVLQRLRKRR